MTIAAPLVEPFFAAEEALCLPSADDFTSSIRKLARAAEADNYLVAELIPDRAGTARIVASDWIYDDVLAFGIDGIGRLLLSPFATFPGAAPRGVHPLMLGALLSSHEVAALRHRGDAELFTFKLFAGEARYGAIFSTRLSGHITSFTASRTQLQCCHLLSDYLRQHMRALCDNPLSLREVECLRWVSEGKTTEEVAVILGVSANTINSYITQSINKLSANNRAMATATALRQGLI